MAKDSNVNYGITVRLSEADVNAISEGVRGQAAPAEKLGAVASGLLRDLARGGVMIEPDWASRIESAVGSTEQSVIVEAVEKSVNRRGEDTIVEWEVDPTQIAWYKQLADNVPPMGISLNQQCKSIMDWAYSQGYFGQNAPDPYKILLEPEQWQYLQKLLAKDIPTGYDVIALLSGERKPEVIEEEDDLVMDALKGGVK